MAIDFALEGELRLSRLDPLIAVWRDALAADDLALDARQVTAVDTAALQAILSAAVLAQAHGRRVTLRPDPAGTIPATLDRLGLARAFAPLLADGPGEHEGPDR